MANTTWSATDKTASITLSNGNLTATTSTTSQGGRSVDQQITGKFYWEYTCNTFVSGSSGVGAANGSATLSGMGAAPTNACLVYPSGAIWLNNANTGSTLGAISAGNVVCLAIDLVNLTLWLRNGAAGNWNGSGTANPATNAGGIACGAIFGGGKNLFAAYALHALNDQITANFGGSAFTGAVPAGFTSGFPVPATSAYVTQSALEQFLTTNPPAQVTQVTIEQWATTATVSGQAMVTQVALEQWALTDAVVIPPPTSGAQARVMVMA